MTGKLFSLYLGSEFQMIAPLKVIRNVLNLHQNAVDRINAEYAAHCGEERLTRFEVDLHKNGQTWCVREGHVFVTVATYGPDADIEPHVGVGLTEGLSQADLDNEIRLGHCDEDGNPFYDDPSECAVSITQKGYQIIGRQSNVAVVEHVFEYLLGAVERQLRQELLERNGAVTSDSLFNRWAHTFRQGCSDRLKDRLEARYKEQIAEQSRKAREANAAARHPGAATGNSLVVVMSDFEQDEKDLNTDMRWGYKPGTTKVLREKNMAEAADREAKRLARLAELKDVEPRVAAMMAHYQVNESLARYWIEKEDEAAKETPSQKRRREAREKRKNERMHERWEREDAHKWSEGYRRGQHRGSNIGLDDQVSKGNQHKLEN